MSLCNETRLLIIRLADCVFKVTVMISSSGLNKHIGALEKCERTRKEETAKNNSFAWNL
jgi:hypothetical protein